MKIIGITVLLLCVAAYSRGQSIQQLRSMFTVGKLRIVCSRGLPFRYRVLELECCKTYKRLMEKYWKNGDRYLSEHLEFLRTWRCPEFAEECDDRRYAFNEFTSLVYERFCNSSELSARCNGVIRDLFDIDYNGSTTPPAMIANSSNQQSSSPDINATPWDGKLTQLSQDLFAGSDLSKPCVLVAMLDSNGGGFGSYQEIMSPSVPFCSVIWCGFSRAILERGVSLHSCMPTNCRVNVIITVAVTVILSLTIIISNLLVILFFAKIVSIKNAQSIYKISMATADLLTGLISMPSVAATLLLSTRQNLALAPNYKLKLPEFSNQFVKWDEASMPGRDGISVRHPTRLSLDEAYIQVIACVTAISILASVYTLAGASIDRLWAVHFPLHYKSFNTKKVATRLVLSIWALTILIALLPFMNIGLKYAPLSAALVLMLGANVHVVYICVLVVPLIVVWTANIVLYFSVRKQTKQRYKITARGINNKRNGGENELQLAKTLLLMVGVFTICVLPIVILSLLSMTYSDELNPANLSTFQLSKVLLFNSLDYVFVIILFCNSLWNVFIYSARNKEFRKAMKNLLPGLCPCGEESRNTEFNSTSDKNQSNIQTNMTTLPLATRIHSEAGTFYEG